MRPWLVASALLAACGPGRAPAGPRPAQPDAAPTPPPAPDARPDALGIDWATVPHASDDDALAIWRRLGLDGDNWQLRLTELPDPDEDPAAADVLEAMAKALLRAGNFACPAVTLRAGCTRVELELTAIAPTDTLDSPCLRRELALWSLDQLDGDTLQTELAPDLVALAALPPPEDALGRAALARVTDEGLRLRMLEAAKAAGNDQVADDNLGNLTVAEIAEAATRLHVDGAIEALDVGEALDAYVHAAADPALRVATRQHVLRDLADYATSLDPSDPARATAIAALDAAAADPDCAIAAAAASALHTADGRAIPGAPGKQAGEAAYVRAMCVTLLGDGDAATLWAAIVGPKGVVVRSTFEGPADQAPPPADADPLGGHDDDGAAETDDAGVDDTGDGPTRTWTEVVRVPRDELDAAPSLDELREALPTCAGTTCTVPADGVTFQLRFVKAGGGRLRLDAIERHERLGGC